MELSDFEAENVTLKGEYLWQVAEIVIGRVPIVVEVCFMPMFMTPGRILLQGCISPNLLDPTRHHVDPGNVEVRIEHFANIYFMGDIIPPDISLGRVLVGIQLSPFVFSCTFRFFTSSVLRALVLGLSFLPARLPSQTSLKL